MNPEANHHLLLIEAVLIWINRSRRVAPSMRQRGPRLVMQEVLKGLKKTETPGSTVTSIAREFHCGGAEAQGEDRPRESLGRLEGRHSNNTRGQVAARVDPGAARVRVEGGEALILARAGPARPR